MGRAEDQFEAMRQVVHFTNRDDYLANMLAQPAPLGLGDRVRFDHSTQTWHIWNGFRWAPDRKTEVFDLVRRVIFDVWLPSQAINRDKDTAKMIMSLMDYSKKVVVLKTLASMPGIAMVGDEWDLHPELMCFENGVLNLRTLQLDPKPDPALLISKSTGLDWDPSADPSEFVNFVTDIMGGDQDLIDYLMSVLGYSMLATTVEQKFWMWVGPGQNGKGVLARTFSKAIGDYAATPPDTLYMRTRYGAASSDKPRPELLKLQATRFTYMSEPPGEQFNEEMLKAHSGSDFIEARTLYAKAFKTFQPTHKIVFLTNDPPKTDDVGPSMQRRVRIIKFEQDYRDPSRDDKTLEPRLQQRENLQGAVLILAHFAQHYLLHGLTEPAKVTEWSRAYISENDPISGFIDAMCVKSPEAVQPAGPMWKAFEAWSESNGYERVTMTYFGLEMGRQYPKKQRSSGTVYVGIRLKNMTDVEDDNE